MLRRLLLLNGLAILCVILFHASGWGFTAMFPWAHAYLQAGASPFQQVGSLSYFGLRFVEQFVIFSIPAFLFVSGLFMAFTTGRSRSGASWQVVGARVRDLAIPYLLWSTILLALLFAQGRRLSPAQVGLDLLIGKTNPAYYYVPLLIQFYLLSPLLTRLAKSRWRQLLLVTGLLQIAVHLLHNAALLYPEVTWLNDAVRFAPKWIFYSRLFWFSLGIVAGFHIRNFEQWLVRMRWTALALALLLLPLGMVEWEFIQSRSGQPWLPHHETLLDLAYSAAFLVAFLGFGKVRVPFTAQLNELGAKSFGIYLVHSPVMEYASRAIFHLAPWLLAYQIALQPLLIVLGLGVPLLLMATVNRSSVRAYYKYSFG